MLLVQAIVDGYRTYHEKMSITFSSGELNKFPESSLFMEIFSLIFDQHYHEHFDFADVICPTVENPYVELVFDQQERIIWDYNQMVTIKRYLREPKRIFVNGQAMDYDEFHSTAASFGFFNFAGICLHRIDQPTIDKLKRITGTTLWTMMNALFKSEDLIRLIESKEHIHKNLMLQKDMKNDMEEMDKQLPYRLQQKDDTKKHFSLSRKLKTLYKVISERESSILSGNKKYFEEETEKQILKMEKHKQFLRKTYNSRIETIAQNESVKKLTDLVENVTLDTEPIKQDLTEYVSYIPFEDIYHRYEDLETSLDEVVVKIESLTSPYLQYLESCFKDECMDTINRIKRQLIRTKDLPSHQVISQKVFQKIEDIKKEQVGLKIDLEEISKELEEDRTLNRQHRLDHHVETEEVVGKVFKFHQDSYELQKKIFDAKKEVFKCTKEKIAAKELIVRCETSCNIYPKLSKTIFDIECFINDPITGSQFKDGYYGPLFNYLQSNDLIERDLWHELVPLMSVFIFGKVSTARAFHLALTKSGKNFEGYTLMGMDDFYTRPYQEIPHDLKEKVDPASEIVKVNIRFHHILFRLLDGNVRVNTKSLNIDLFRSKVAVVSEDTLSIGYWNSLISVGWFTNASVSTEDSPLDHLQTLYRFIEGYLKEDYKLRSIQNELESSKTELEDLHRYEHRIDYVILHRAKDKFHLLMERELKLKEDLIRSDVELNCFDSFKTKLNCVDSWNLEEITAWILKVDLKKVKQKMRMKCEIEQEFAKLHDINLVISIHNNEMERWMLKTLDHWNQWNVATISNHKNYLVLCQELNNDYFKTILASMSEGMDMWNYKCDNSQVAQEYFSKIKLIEIKGMLHKLYNDLKFLKSEMAACQQVVRDSDANDVAILGAYKECDLEYVIEAIDELQNELKECPEPLSREQYVDLRETIQDIVNFSTAPTHQVVAQNTVTPKAFPFVNRLVVKMLQDTLVSYELTYKYAMSKFIRKGTLYCYEDSAKDASAITNDNFDWQYFDLSRFKSIDFKTTWAGSGRGAVGDEAHLVVKAFLLIIHLVRYASHFKFIIIDEKLYDIMDNQLAAKIGNILEMMSTYVQIFIVGP